ncbi:MAG: biopolymer transporter ExbD [Bacteroidetes bacterium]|nr:biopolymer transporter ExbD [Bacteroidota bacterium]
MSKFGKKQNEASPQINTSSLPDIIFILLFFFMMVVVMRTEEIQLEIKVPQATELQKLKKKHLVSYVYIGVPKAKLRAKWGNAPRIQLNDVFKSFTEIGPWVENERKKLPEKLRPYMTVSLRVDRDIKMGIVTDVKLELRKANALKINYSATKRSKFGE